MGLGIVHWSPCFDVRSRWDRKPVHQKSPSLYSRNPYIALISKLTSTLWLEVLSWRFSFGTYVGLGSHCDVGWAASLCGKTWHAPCQRKHYKLTLVMFHPYCRHKASRKPHLFREKWHSSNGWGKVDNYEDAPFSPLLSINLCLMIGDWWWMLLAMSAAALLSSSIYFIDCGNGRVFLKVGVLMDDWFDEWCRGFFGCLKSAFTKAVGFPPFPPSTLEGLKLTWKQWLYNSGY